jgi:hypothetical protein
VHVGDHGHATRVVLERGVVEPLLTGRHSHLPFFRWSDKDSAGSRRRRQLAGPALAVPSCSFERRSYPTRHKWRKRYDKPCLTCQLSHA